jgi:poly(A) polymerase
LPDDVFEPGEVKPVRPKKKVIKKTEAAGQKRNFSQLDVSVQKKARRT